MIDAGQRCLDLVQMLMVEEKINKTVAANIAREVQDVMVKGTSARARVCECVCVCVCVCASVCIDVSRRTPREI